MITTTIERPVDWKERFGFSFPAAVLNLIIHAILFGVAAFVAYKNIGDYVLYSTHVTLMLIGYLILTSQAILTMSDNNFLTYTLTHKLRKLIHWVLSAIAGVLIAISVGCIFQHKNNKGKPHFQSVHAILGLITISLTLISIGSGVFVMYKLPFDFLVVRPITKKLSHSVLGVVTYILAIVAIGFGIWKSTTDDDFARGSLITLIVITTIYILLKPLALVISRVNNM